ncbi:hypothetical protein [Cellulomonas sp. IC4_254]|uniref:hypothetical protein n=1 Tax=Cellulomonas sp. IC4_254 TaxID=2714040 RepID=UPI0014242C9B|nr:hypothetical protein [Cellulomonas sp. IC4_254]NHT19422.1 hypothetical protein [Cellulomonas sp. IC4_254]
MRTRIWATLSTVVLGAALLAACGPGDEDRTTRSTAEHPATPAPTAATRDTAEDDAAACAAFGDVLTIVENADVALAEGRMAAQEQQGWYQLATRVLGRLPADGGGAVQRAVSALQQAAPSVPSGAYAESTGVGSPEWSQAATDLGTACDEIGAPPAITAFTGG